MFDLRDLRGLVAPSLVAVALTGCGGGGGDAEGGAEAEGGAPAAEVPFPVDAATAGNVTGTVNFTGTAPANEAIDMAEEPTCASEHTTPPTRETVVASGGKLANVFVYVKEGLDASLRFPAGEGQTLDQDGCVYEPHVIALSAGEQLTVRNSDGVLHNVNATPSTNRGFNRSQPQEGMEFQTSFPQPEVMIPVRCDVHGWMEAYIGVTSHPYHAVSGADGSFSLERLPPGTYTLEAWHERYGTATQTVEVTSGGTAEVTFEFNESMAGREVPMGPVLLIDHHAGTATRVAQQ
jgi:plastocyanin